MQETQDAERMPYFCLHVIGNFLREGYNQGKFSDEITDKNLTILHATDMRSHSHQPVIPPHVRRLRWAHARFHALFADDVGAHPRRGDGLDLNPYLPCRDP